MFPCMETSIIVLRHQLTLKRCVPYGAMALKDSRQRKRTRVGSFRAEQYHSDEAAGVNMACVLDRVEENPM